MYYTEEINDSKINNISKTSHSSCNNTIQIEDISERNSSAGNKIVVVVVVVVIVVEMAQTLNN